MTDSGYLARLDRRRERDAQSRWTVFGLVLGWLAVLVGSLRWAFVPGSSKWLWPGLVLLGLVLLACATLLPSLLSGPEKVLRRVTGGVGRLIFGAVLIVLFHAVVVPAGWLLRRRHGTSPYYWWKDEPPSEVEGWRTQDDPELALASRLGRGAPLLSQPFLIVAYFIQRRSFFLIPSLCVLLILGLVLFFIETSALAPFLYSLF